MSLFDMFRSWFGLPDKPNKRYNLPVPDDEADEFYKSMWYNNGEADSGQRPVPDDEADEFYKSMWYNNGEADSGQRGRLLGLDFFGAPLEMRRFFENQMSMMIERYQILDDPFVLTEVPALPSIEDHTSRSPRDEVLKPGYKSSDEHSPEGDIIVDEPLAKFGFSRIFNGGSQSQLNIAVPSGIMSQSVRRKVIKRCDGSLEHEEVTRDSNGNEQRTVTRTIGNQSHSIVTTTGPNGVETTETLENIEQDKLDEFLKKWDKGKAGKPPVRPKLGIIPDDFPFDQFFK